MKKKSAKPTQADDLRPQDEERLGNRETEKETLKLLEALRKSEAILNETGHIARIGGWEHDLITGKAIWTKALYEIYELESGQPPGAQEHLNQYPSRDRAILEAAYQRAVEAGVPFDLELQVYTAKKHLIWGRVIGRPEMEHGKCVRMMGAFLDITERKKAEEDLRRASEKSRELEFIINRSPAVVFLWKAEEGWPVEYVSENIRQFGYAPEEFTSGRIPFASFVHPDDLQRIAGEILVYSREPGREHFEQAYRVVSPSGKVYWLDDRSWIRRNEEGEITHYQGIVVDVTEHRKAEEALRMSEAQLSNALKMAKAGHWEYDIDSDLFTFNENFYRIFRTTGSKVGRYTMSSSEYARRFCHPDDLSIVGRETQAAIDTRDPDFSRRFEHRILYADGEIGHMAVRFFIVKDKNGRTIRTYGVNQDITERKRAEEALAESEERFRQLFANMKSGVAVYEAVNNGEDFIFKDINLAVQRIDRVKRKDVLGRKVCDVFPNVKEFGLFDVFQRVWRTGNPEHYPVSLYKDKRIMGWRENHVYKLPSGELVVVYDDVTESKRAEEAIRNQMDELHRWQKVTLGREARILELKREVNKLLTNAGQAAKYKSVEDETKK